MGNDDSKAKAERFEAKYESERGGRQNLEREYVQEYSRQQQETQRAEMEAEEHLANLRIKEKEAREKEREVERQKAELRNIGSLAESQAQQIQNLENEAQRREQERRDAQQQLQDAESKLEKLKIQQEEQRKREEEQMAFKWGRTTKMDWTESALSRFRDDFFKPRQDSSGKELQLKILIFGPTGCGKSTLCNGFRSALQGEKYVSHFHAVAATAETMTKGFKGAKYGKHWIIDMGGIYETKSITDENIRDIASGKVPFYAGLTKNLEFEKKKIDAPKAGDNDVSCVVIVLRSGMTLAKELERQIGVIIQLAGEGVVTYHLVLTCLDIADPKFTDPDELPTLFDSPSVQAAVKQMSEETGIPPTSISFVRNYVKEDETDLYTNILLLKALDKIVFDAAEQVENNIMKNLQKEEYKKKNRFFKFGKK